MEKKLITEVQRIKEIMGVNSNFNLLLEARNPLEDIIQFAIDFIKREEKPSLIPNPSVIRVGLVDVAKNTMDAIRTFLRTGDWDNLSDLNARNLGTILSQDTTYAEKLYQEQFRKAMGLTNLSEEDLLKKIDADLGPNYTSQDLQTYLARTFTNPSDPSSVKPAEVISGALTPKISKRMKEAKSGTFKSEIASAEGFVKKVGKNMTPPVILAFKQILGRGFFTSTEKLEQKIDEIIARIQKKLSAETGQPLEKINRDVRELFNTIIAMKKSADTNIRNLYDYHITNNPKIPNEVKEELKKEKYVEEIVKYMDEDLANATFPILMQKAQAFTESIPLVGGLLRFLAKWFRGDKVDFQTLGKSMGINLKRVMNQIAYKSPLSMEEAVVNFSRTGKWATLGEKAAGYLFVHNIFVPFVLQSIEGAFTNREIIKLRDEVRLILELCGDSELKGVINCPEEDIQVLKNYSEKAFVDGMLNKIPILKPFRGDLKGSDVLFFTYIDEVIEGAVDLWWDTEFSDQDILQKTVERVKGTANKYREQLKMQGIDIDNVQVVQDWRALQSKKYDNSEPGFKSYIKDNTGQDTTGLQNLKLPNGNYEYWGDEYEWKKDGLSNLGQFKIVER